MRARLAVFASGVRCEVREVVLRDKPAEMLAVSPKGTVPVVVLADGAVIDESLDVMLWALQQHDPEKWLAPSIGSDAEMLDLVSACDGAFKTNLDRYKYASRGEPGAGLQARADGAEFLKRLDEQLTGRPFLFGARMALADMAILPFVRQFALVDRAWFDGEEWPRLASWLDGFLQSERFAHVMRKYPQWQAGAEPVQFGGQN